MKHKSDYIMPADRQSHLTAERNLKMARSAHAYVRGNTLKFYEWLESTSKPIPEGPPVWICGDCHIGNLGPIANSKGHIDIQIRDLDQTVIGNPAHDVIRLALSLATAARGSDLPGVTTAKMLEQLVEGYEKAFDADAKEDADAEWPQAIDTAMKNALKRKWKHLARERIEDTTPAIPLGKKFWPLSKTEKKEITALFESEAVRKLVTSLRSRDNDASVTMLDAAYWMKGCSSLGRLRYAVLLGIGDKNKEMCLVDVKEAIAPAAPHYTKAKMPRDNAARVVEGACQLSPFLGGRMLAAKLNNHSVFLRELLPQDLKFNIEHITREEAMRVAYFLATVVGKAHARQMDKATRLLWQKELQRNRSKTLDAPSWLWSAVVDLMVSHEATYLEHCRKYAMGLTLCQLRHWPCNVIASEARQSSVSAVWRENTTGLAKLQGLLFDLDCRASLAKTWRGFSLNYNINLIVFL